MLTTLSTVKTRLAILVPRYPIESVTKFELKSTEAEGWVEQTDIDYLIRKRPRHGAGSIHRSHKWFRT